MRTKAAVAVAGVGPLLLSACDGGGGGDATARGNAADRPENINTGSTCPGSSGAWCSRCARRDLTILVALTILLETALSYLGFGVQTPDTSLGLLVSEAQTALTTRPWLFYFPGVFIIVIALTINFSGDGLRDAFDPQQTKVRQ